MKRLLKTTIMDNNTQKNLVDLAKLDTTIENIIFLYMMEDNKLSLKDLCDTIFSMAERRMQQEGKFTEKHLQKI